MSRPASNWILRAILTLVIALSGYLSASDAQAQSPRITHEVIKTRLKQQSMGRDLWFVMPENYQWSSTGKYYELYVTSPDQTTVRVEIGKDFKKTFPIAAGEVAIQRIPLAYEMTESGTVENKAVHIYSDDADITAYVLSRNPYTSDGMYVIPTIGWGTEYVVAAYNSHWAGTAGGDGDLPSEFAIVANQDNTVVTVTPTTNIRNQQDADKMLFEAGKPFTVTLMRGQSVQYQSMRNPSQAEGFDFTGTTLSSTKPIGVVAGVMCANVPVEFPWCDHICDMIPPLRTWATTYYTAPFIARKGGDTYLVIASENNQTIYRTEGMTERVHATLNKHESFFRHDIDKPSKWHSDKPFLVVQYCNSTSWPGYFDGVVTNDGIGDPQMTVVNAVEQFSPKVVFQTPSIATGQSAFTNYVNVIVHSEAIASTTFNGIKITGAPGMTMIPIDGNYVAFRASNVRPGSHTVVSDSGVGVYVYGYGSYDSYGWTGSFGTSTFRSPDTVAPNVTTPTECFTAHVTTEDIHVNASKLHAMDLDSIYNMEYTPDVNWVAGAGMDKSFYDMKVIDPTKDGFMRVLIYDAAGNTTIVTSRYRPQIATIDPPLTDFGVGSAGSPIVKEVTLTNTGSTDFNMTELRLQFNTRGFTIVEPADRSPLKAGETRKIKVSFEPVSQQTLGDTVIFGDECITMKATVIGNGGAPDFSVSGVDIGPIYVGTTKESDAGAPLVSPATGVLIRNSSNSIVKITNISISNTTDFSIDLTRDENKVPFDVLPGTNHEVVVMYHAHMEPGAQTNVNFTAQGFSEDKVAIVTGKAIAPGAQIIENTIDTLRCVVAGDSRPYQFQIKATGSAATMVKAVTSNTLPEFTAIEIRDASNNLVGLPRMLNKDETWFVNTTFNAPADVNGTYVLTINVIGEDDQVIQNGTVVATAVTEYRAIRINNAANLNFAPANYGGLPVTATFEIENTTEHSVSVLRPMPTAGNMGSHPNSFTITNPGTWPVTLAPFQKVTVTVQFDPTLSTAEQQTVNYTVDGDACESVTVSAAAGTLVGGFTAQGFPAPQIFSCTNSTNDVVVTAGNSPTGEVRWTITGANLDRFTTTLPSPQPMVSNQQLRIPVTFTPSAISQQASYTANIELIYTNEQGREYTEVIPMSATAGGIIADATSRFALQNNNEVTTGDEILLPINMVVTKNVPTIDMTTTGIASARFVYTYNEDLLTVENNNLATQVKNLAPGWSLDQGASSVTSGRVEVVLTAAPGTEIGQTERLADIRFLVRLADQSQQDDSLRLEAFELRDATGQAYSSCASTSAAGTYLNLALRCGDAVFQSMMNGATGFSKIEPVTPNPITDQKLVTLRYATRVSTPITIEIIDQLGNKVDEVMSNLDHEAGAFEVKYDVSNLKSGSYVYRFKTAQSTLSQRFVVTK